MVILQAIILGIIEGLTEFLPISSTGHLIVAERALGYYDSAQLFTVVIQVGAIAAVVWFYRRDLAARIVGFIRAEKPAVRFWLNLFIAAIPAGVAGLALHDAIERFAVPSTVAAALIAGGLVLWLVEVRLARRGVSRPTRVHAPRAASPASSPGLDAVTPRQAFQIGLAQVVSLVPGVSRSGATIVGGLASGLDRVTATTFSFYLGIPMITMASGYKLISRRDEITNVSGGWPAIGAGTLMAFLTALFVVGWLLRYVARHDFKPFAYYRIALGLLLVVLLLTGLMPNHA